MCKFKKSRVWCFFLFTLLLYMASYKNITHRSQRGTKLYSGITQENNTSLGIIMKNNSVYACQSKRGDPKSRNTKVVLNHINHIKNCPCNVDLHEEENPLCMTSAKMEFRGVPQLNYLPETTSPCVILQNTKGNFVLINNTNTTLRKRFWLRGNSDSLVLGCLPSVYLLGVGKCGTTFLHHCLSQHRTIMISQRKEMEFWNGGNRWERPFYRDDNNISRYNLFAYMSLSNPVANEIYGNIHLEMQRVDDLDKITKNNLHILDSSTTNVFSEHAIKLHKLVPNAKAIVILRDPVSREFSAFRFAAQISGKRKISWFRDQSPEGFDKYINYTITKSTGQRFRLSTYSVLVKELLKIFPKENLVIVQYEELVRDAVGMLESQILPMLKLAPFMEGERDKVLPNTVKNKGRLVYNMLDRTKITLQNYFRKYNQELSELLEDTKWTWGY